MRDDLISHAKLGVLHAIFYNDHPTEMIDVMDLESGEYIDGHPNDWAEKNT